MELLSVCVRLPWGGCVWEVENAPKLVENNSTTDIKSKFNLKSCVDDTFYFEHNDALQPLRKKERQMYTALLFLSILGLLCVL